MSMFKVQNWQLLTWGVENNHQLKGLNGLSSVVIVKQWLRIKSLFFLGLYLEIFPVNWYQTTNFAFVPKWVGVLLLFSDVWLLQLLLNCFASHLKGMPTSIWYYHPSWKILLFLLTEVVFCQDFPVVARFALLVTIQLLQNMVLEFVLLGASDRNWDRCPIILIPVLWVWLCGAYLCFYSVLTYKCPHTLPPQVWAA